MGKIKYNGFSEVSLILRDGGLDALHIKDAITTRHDSYGDIAWEIIGRHPDRNTVTVFMRNPPIWRCFDEPCKEWPFGLGVWETSSIRRMLQSREFMDGFDPDDEAAVKEATKRTYNPLTKRFSETKDRFFLLSASEMCFPLKPGVVFDEGIPYEAFAGTGDETRRKLDVDGDECHYWLRSVYPSYADIVRFVNSSGALYNVSAYYCHGLAAGCEIGVSDNPRR